MDIFDEKILNFWKTLQEYHVQYIMIGDYATNLHGYQRFTGNMDLWLKDTLENRQQLRKVFISCNIGDYLMIEYMQFVPVTPSSILTMASD